MRYSLIVTTGILFYVTLLRTVASSRLAGAFSLSLVLFFWFGWEIHPASPIRSRCLQRRSLCSSRCSPMLSGQRGGLLLGLIAGIGLMAKWSFLLVVLSLGVALAVTRETRAYYREPRMLL